MQRSVNATIRDEITLIDKGQISAPQERIEQNMCRFANKFDLCKP